MDMTDFDKYIIQSEPEKCEKARIWQIHPFAEGNTRTTAVFAMKYLQTFGFKPDNYLFKDHSWYFRNALVRANYNNFHKGVSATDVFLIRFFRNLLLGENNVLSNREMHISNTQSLTLKSQNDTLDCTLEEMAILRFLQTKPDARQEEIARHIGKSLSTVKRITPSLIERGLLARENGRRNGRWVGANSRIIEWRKRPGGDSGV